MRKSDNYIDDTEIEVQRRRTGGWELGLNHREYLGASTLDMNLAYRRGTGAFRAMPAPEEDFGEGTSRMQVITADAQWLIPFQLGAQRPLYRQLARQWNRTPLAPQDRFSIGGRYTVRGFDGELTLMGERGWVLRNEIGLPVGAGQELYAGPTMAMWPVRPRAGSRGATWPARLSACAAAPRASSGISSPARRWPGPRASRPPP